MYADMSGIGNTSRHQENLSTHVNRYHCPSHLRSGLVMSMWMCLNLFVHALTSALIRSQTNLSVNKRTDALAPGWDKLCTAVKMSLLKDAGTYGRNLTVLVSQMMLLG